MSSFGFQPHPIPPKDIGEYREHRQQVLGAVREHAFQGVRHKGKKRKKAKKVKKVKSVARHQEFMGVHQSAMSNKLRDQRIAENIKTRLKEDDTLTENQTKELKNIRRELVN